MHTLCCHVQCRSCMCIEQNNGRAVPAECIYEQVNRQAVVSRMCVLDLRGSCSALQGRPGLLRTVLEAQETRGLTRSDDISRLLPSEAANMARGRRVRQSKLLFFAKGIPTRES